MQEKYTNYKNLEKIKSYISESVSNYKSHTDNYPTISELSKYINSCFNTNLFNINEETEVNGNHISSLSKTVLLFLEQAEEKPRYNWNGTEYVNSVTGETSTAATARLAAAATTPAATTPAATTPAATTPAATTPAATPTPKPKKTKPTPAATTPAATTPAATTPGVRTASPSTFAPNKFIAGAATTAKTVGSGLVGALGYNLVDLARENTFGLGDNGLVLNAVRDFTPRSLGALGQQTALDATVAGLDTAVSKPISKGLTYLAGKTKQGGTGNKLLKGAGQATNIGLKDALTMTMASRFATPLVTNTLGIDRDSVAGFATDIGTQVAANVATSKSAGNLALKALDRSAATSWVRPALKTAGQVLPVIKTGLGKAVAPILGSLVKKVVPGLAITAAAKSYAEGDAIGGHLNALSAVPVAGLPFAGVSALRDSSPEGDEAVSNTLFNTQTKGQKERQRQAVTDMAQEGANRRRDTGQPAHSGDAEAIKSYKSELASRLQQGASERLARIAGGSNAELQKEVGMTPDADTSPKSTPETPLGTPETDEDVKNRMNKELNNRTKAFERDPQTGQKLIFEYTLGGKLRIKENPSELAALLKAALKDEQITKSGKETPFDTKQNYAYELASRSHLDIKNPEVLKDFVKRIEANTSIFMSPEETAKYVIRDMEKYPSTPKLQSRTIDPEILSEPQSKNPLPYTAKPAEVMQPVESEPSSILEPTAEPTPSLQLVPFSTKAKSGVGVATQNTTQPVVQPAKSPVKKVITTGVEEKKPNRFPNSPTPSVIFNNPQSSKPISVNSSTERWQAKRDDYTKNKISTEVINEIVGHTDSEYNAGDDTLAALKHYAAVIDQEREAGISRSTRVQSRASRIANQLMWDQSKNNGAGGWSYYPSRVQVSDPSGSINENKLKYKIIIQEGTHTRESFVSSIKEIKESICAVDNYKIYDVTGSNITNYFKRLTAGKKSA